MIERKIHFGTSRVVLNAINAENIEKFKLAHVRGFNFLCSMTPKQIFLVQSSKCVKGYEIYN